MRHGGVRDLDLYKEESMHAIEVCDGARSVLNESILVNEPRPLLRAEQLNVVVGRLYAVHAELELPIRRRVLKHT